MKGENSEMCALKVEVTTLTSLWLWSLCKCSTFLSDRLAIRLKISNCLYIHHKCSTFRLGPNNCATATANCDCPCSFRGRQLQHLQSNKQPHTTPTCDRRQKP